MLQRAAAEFVGTFALVFVGAGSIIVSGQSGLVGIALAHGLAIAVMVSAVGHISGGHFNPAVTVGFLLTRRITTDRAIAYVVAQVAGAAPAGELRRFLSERLPDHMVPSAFVALDAFPLTPNGKVDRAALPAPDASGPGADGSRALPRTPTETVVATIWADVLGLDVAEVGVDDDFFDLGGHSLLATQMVARVRDAFKVEVPLQALFERPTVAEFALVVLEAQFQQADGAGFDDLFSQVEQATVDHLAPPETPGRPT